MRMKQKLFSILALLLMAATGAWAQSAFTAKEITSASQLTSTDDGAYVAACMPSDFLAVDADVAKAWTGAPKGSAILIYAIDGDKIKMATFLNGSNKATTGATWSIATFKDQLPNGKFFYTAPAPTYSVTLAEGTEDGDNWTISPTEAAEGATVTATYKGEKKVKSVKAVKVDAAPAAVTPAAITVTIKQDDWGWESITKDGVTVSAGLIDPISGNLMSDGTFSTTLGNFTKIVVTAKDCNVSGTGWSGGGSSITWAGTPASTVSFSGNINGHSGTQTTIVCTIVPTN